MNRNVVRCYVLFIICVFIRTNLWNLQSHWKGYLARKDSKGRLLDLRLRMQKSAANVDNSMRILNRLIAALSELLTMKSVSGILHTCETLGKCSSSLGRY